MIQLLYFLLVTLGNSVNDDLLAEVFIELRSLLGVERVLQVNGVAVDAGPEEFGKLRFICEFFSEIHVWEDR